MLTEKLTFSQHSAAVIVFKKGPTFLLLLLNTTNSTACKDSCCWVFYPCYSVFFFSLTPIAIDYREPNNLAPMQQPSSVVHANYKTHNL